MVVTIFECNKCDFKVEVKTQPGEAFMMAYHTLKVFIAKQIIKLHCIRHLHGYHSLETFE